MSDKSMEYTTVYDDVFRTMLERTPKLIVYLINEVFSENYDESEPVTLLQNEHLSEDRKIVTDSYIKICNKYYHIECQSNPDGSMAIRMMEYDFMIALQNAEKQGYDYTIKYPNSCVLYLRHNNNTPDYITVNVVLPNKSSFIYKTPIVKVQNYDIDDIFEKKLLAFLPYYIMRYGKRQLEEIESDSDKRKVFVEIYEKIFNKVQELSDTNLSEFEILKIRDYILKILEWVAREEPKIKKEVHDMCGKVIRTKVDDVFDDGKKDMAINMYKGGMSIEVIAGFARVSVETVKKWLVGVTTPAK